MMALYSMLSLAEYFGVLFNIFLATYFDETHETGKFSTLIRADLYYQRGFKFYELKFLHHSPAPSIRRPLIWRFL